MEACAPLAFLSSADSVHYVERDGRLGAVGWSSCMVAAAMLDADRTFQIACPAVMFDK
jgi:hypothetical protein